MIKQRTTDLSLLRKGYPLTWGNLIKIHDIGDYSIVEYDDPTVKQGPMRNFSVYMDGKNMHATFDSLDKAIVYAVIVKYAKVASTAHHITDFLFKGLLQSW